MKLLTIALAAMFISFTAHAGTAKQSELNWLETIIQTLTGTQATTENPKTIHTTIRKSHLHKHGHRHASTIHKSHASAGVTKSPVHTKNEKLYEEFQIWYYKQLFNPMAPEYQK